MWPSAGAFVRFLFPPRRPLFRSFFGELLVWDVVVWVVVSSVDAMIQSVLKFLGTSRLGMGMGLLVRVNNVQFLAEVWPSFVSWSAVVYRRMDDGRVQDVEGFSNHCLIVKLDFLLFVLDHD